MASPQLLWDQRSLFSSSPLPPSTAEIESLEEQVRTLGSKLGESSSRLENTMAYAGTLERKHADREAYIAGLEAHIRQMEQQHLHEKQQLQLEQQQQRQQQEDDGSVQTDALFAAVQDLSLEERSSLPRGSRLSKITPTALASKVASLAENDARRVFDLLKDRLEPEDADAEQSSRDSVAKIADSLDQANPQNTGFRSTESSWNVASVVAVDTGAQEKASLEADLAQERAKTLALETEAAALRAQIAQLSEKQQQQPQQHDREQDVITHLQPQVLFGQPIQASSVVIGGVQRDASTSPPPGSLHKFPSVSVLSRSASMSPIPASLLFEPTSPRSPSMSVLSRPMSPDAGVSSSMSVSSRMAPRDLVRLIEQFNVKCLQIDGQATARLAWLAGELGIVSWQLSVQEAENAELRASLHRAEIRETAAKDVEHGLKAQVQQLMADIDAMSVTAKDYDVLQDRLMLAEETRRAQNRTVDNYKLACQQMEAKLASDGSAHNAYRQNAEQLQQQLEAIIAGHAARIAALEAELSDNQQAVAARIAGQTHAEVQVTETRPDTQTVGVHAAMPDEAAAQTHAAAVASLNATIAALESQLQAAKADAAGLDELQKSHDALLAKLNAAQQELEAARSSSRAAPVPVAASSAADMAALNDKIRVLEDALAAAKGDAAGLDELESSHNSLVERFNALKQELHDATKVADVLRSTAAKDAARIENMQKQNNALQQQLAAEQAAHHDAAQLASRTTLALQSQLENALQQQQQQPLATSAGGDVVVVRGSRGLTRSGSLLRPTTPVGNTLVETTETTSTTVTSPVPRSSSPVPMPLPLPPRSRSASPHPGSAEPPRRSSFTITPDSWEAERSKYTFAINHSKAHIAELEGRLKQQADHVASLEADLRQALERAAKLERDIASGGRRQTASPVPSGRPTTPAPLPTPDSDRRCAAELAMLEERIVALHEQIQALSERKQETEAETAAAETRLAELRVQLAAAAQAAESTSRSAPAAAPVDNTESLRAHSELFETRAALSHAEGERKRLAGLVYELEQEVEALAAAKNAAVQAAADVQRQVSTAEQDKAAMAGEMDQLKADLAKLRDAAAVVAAPAKSVDHVLYTDAVVQTLAAEHVDVSVSASDHETSTGSALLGHDHASLSLSQQMTNRASSPILRGARTPSPLPSFNPAVSSVHSVSLASLPSMIVRADQSVQVAPVTADSQTQAADLDIKGRTVAAVADPAATADALRVARERIAELQQQLDEQTKALGDLRAQLAQAAPLKPVASQASIKSVQSAAPAAGDAIVVSDASVRSPSSTSPTKKGQEPTKGRSGFGWSSWFGGGGSNARDAPSGRVSPPRGYNTLPTVDAGDSEDDEADAAKLDGDDGEDAIALSVTPRGVAGVVEHSRDKTLPVVYEIVSPASAGAASASSGPSTADLQAELASSKQMAAARETQAVELQARIVVLESELDGVRQALSVTDAKCADLATQLKNRPVRPPVKDSDAQTAAVTSAPTRRHVMTQFTPGSTDRGAAVRLQQVADAASARVAELEAGIAASRATIQTQDRDIQALKELHAAQQAAIQAQAQTQAQTQADAKASPLTRSAPTTAVAMQQTEPVPETKLVPPATRSASFQTDKHATEHAALQTAEDARLVALEAERDQLVIQLSLSEGKLSAFDALRGELEAKSAASAARIEALEKDEAESHMAASQAEAARHIGELTAQHAQESSRLQDHVQHLNIVHRKAEEELEVKARDMRELSDRYEELRIQWEHDQALREAYETERSKHAETRAALETLRHLYQQEQVQQEQQGYRLTRSLFFNNDLNVSAFANRSAEASTTEAALQTQMSAADMAALEADVLALRQMTEALRAQIQEVESVRASKQLEMEAMRDQRINELEGLNARLAEGLEFERSEAVHEAAAELLDVYRAHLVDVALDRDRLRTRFRTFAHAVRERMQMDVSETEEHIIVTSTQRLTATVGGGSGDSTPEMPSSVVSADASRSINTSSPQAREAVAGQAATDTPLSSSSRSSNQQPHTAGATSSNSHTGAAASASTSIPSSITLDSTLTMSLQLEEAEKAHQYDAAQIRRLKTEVSVLRGEPSGSAYPGPLSSSSLVYGLASSRVAMDTISVNHAAAAAAEGHSDVADTPSQSTVERLRTLIDKQADDIVRLEYELWRSQALLNAQQDNIKELMAQVAVSGDAATPRPSALFSPRTSGEQGRPVDSHQRYIGEGPFAGERSTMEDRDMDERASRASRSNSARTSGHPSHFELTEAQMQEIEPALVYSGNAVSAPVLGPGVQRRASGISAWFHRLSHGSAPHGASTSGSGPSSLGSMPPVAPYAAWPFSPVEQQEYEQQQHQSRSVTPPFLVAASPTGSPAPSDVVLAGSTAGGLGPRKTTLKFAPLPTIASDIDAQVLQRAAAGPSSSTGAASSLPIAIPGAGGMNSPPITPRMAMSHAMELDQELLGALRNTELAHQVDLLQEQRERREDRLESHRRASITAAATNQHATNIGGSSSNSNQATNSSNIKHNRRFSLFRPCR
ncbi:hypothetical protein BC831DRAFT_463171 [Entophlyctis helioformis]|nr:hypothetical protein BC831DRAFT_463171 [Entophlyctis helioformis]